MLIKDKIQNTVGDAVLKRNYKRLSRKRFIHNLSSAQRVGVLFSPSGASELKIVKGFLAFLTNLDIKVFPLAYLDSKKTDINMVMEQHINFVDKKHFNWFHRPMTPEIKDFIKEEFDILINLSMNNILPINFIVSLSRAKLKVGKYFEEKESFTDLMIDIKDSKDMSFLIEQTSHYLSVINNTK